MKLEYDEDEKREYRLIREEVREFKGKNIMESIKEKKMNRIKMKKVNDMGEEMKNG